jgi:hypothetical protein
VQPIQAMVNALASLLAGATAYLAPSASANIVALIVAPFTKGPNLVVADLTLASFAGSTPIAGMTGTQDVGNDPNTGQQVITIIAPSGGWVFTCTTAPATPQTVFGYALLNNAGTTLLATEYLIPNTTITNIGDFIDLGKITFTLNPAPLS